jgi:hypothetical protein
MVKKYNSELFIQESTKIHNNKYDYSNIIWKNTGIKVKIICNEHGEFEQRPSNHLMGKVCSYCSGVGRITKTIFLERAHKIHGDKYDYIISNNEVRNTKNIEIKCKVHGIFTQTLNNHLKGTGCPNCCKNAKITNEKFLERSKKIHGDKYDYSNVEYIHITKPVKIICKVHGEFEQTPREHFSGCGCYKCANRIITTQDFIEKANIRHNNLYDYSKVEYKSSREKIIISCKTHGDFIQTPNDHLNGCGCQKCGMGNYSKICIEWLETIMKNENIFIQHGNNRGEITIKSNKKLFKFDGYCKETNTVYEFMGDFFHGNPKLYNQNDINPLNKKTFGELYNETLKRLELIKNEGYNIITIWESDYKNNKK